ncbi:uncharacterized protein LOC143280091 isoform X3 [Babylonia areolata]|uniref:uncharacterized protein LOC143280091 isoform X3 n=1 Tax=Babylonia areolata TaxID=304850 RepID=UPI003FD1A684
MTPHVRNVTPMHGRVIVILLFLLHSAFHLSSAAPSHVAEETQALTRNRQPWRDPVYSFSLWRTSDTSHSHGVHQDVSRMVTVPLSVFFLAVLLLLLLIWGRRAPGQWLSREAVQYDDAAGHNGISPTIDDTGELAIGTGNPTSSYNRRQ